MSTSSAPDPLAPPGWALWTRAEQGVLWVIHASLLLLVGGYLWLMTGGNGGTLDLAQPRPPLDLVARLQADGTEELAAAPQPKPLAVPQLQLDVNTAPAAEWTLLPGIGEVLAGRIVAAREAQGGFRRLEDLLQVRGIGPKTLARLKPFLRPLAVAPGSTEVTLSQAAAIP